MSDEPRQEILRAVVARGAVRTSDIARKTGLSRTYVHRLLQQMENEGILTLIGDANQGPAPVERA